MSTRGEDLTRFSAVDKSHDPRFFIEFLELRKTVEGEREVKDLIIELLGLRPGVQVLDVGCGLGDDAREIAGIVGASGRVVGIDPSETMIAESKKEPLVWRSLWNFRLATCGSSGSRMGPSIWFAPTAY